MIIVLPDPCIFFWSSGKAPQTRSTFRPTFGLGGATKTEGGVRTSGPVMKWGYLLHYMPETYTVSKVITSKG